MPEFIDYRVDDHVGVITLNRPETMNALNRQMYAELEQAFRGMKQHNEGAGDPAEWKIQAHTQRALLHLSQIADVSR